MQKREHWLIRHPWRGAAIIVTAVQLTGYIFMLMLIPSKETVAKAILDILFCTQYIVVALYQRASGNLFFEDVGVMAFGLLINWLVYTVVVAYMLSLVGTRRRNAAINGANLR